MRPPLNAGENRGCTSVSCAVKEASMRPPLNAGENVVLRVLVERHSSSFNEAPAERGGKRVWHLRGAGEFRLLQ